MSTNPTKRIEEIDRRLEELPKGTLTYKKINGKEQPYIQRTIDGKSVSYYVKLSERERVLVEFEERTNLLEEKKHLTAYAEGLKDILKHNPYLSAKVVIGYQDFEDFTCGQQFYVDKTHFITEWLREGTKITLITRPRRFGKTTLLRDLIRQLSDGNAYGPGLRVGVVDERSELAGAYRGRPQNDLGMRTDVLDACPKVLGMLLLLRSMSPQVIAVDELGEDADIRALHKAAACGCRLLATIHGTDEKDAARRLGIDEICRMFDRIVILKGRGLMECRCLEGD